MSNTEEHRTGVLEELENESDFFENNMNDESDSKSSVRRGAMLDTPLPRSNHSSEYVEEKQEFPALEIPK